MTEEDEGANPKEVDLDEEESILLKWVKFQDGEEEAEINIGIVEQAYINAFVNYSIETSPKEDTLFTRLRPYIEKAMEKSQNWTVFSKSLMLRSVNEIDRSKTWERALIQMQTLVDQFNDAEPCLAERFAYFYVSGYPYNWELKK